MLVEAGSLWPLSRLDTQAIWLAVFAAMTTTFLFREPFFLGLGAELFGDFALLFYNHVPAFGHAEGLFE